MKTNLENTSQTQIADKRSLSDLSGKLVGNLRTLKRKIIVWIYKDIEPYKTRRTQRKINKWMKKFQFGIMAIGNNIEPMIKAFSEAGKAIGDFRKAYSKFSN